MTLAMCSGPQVYSLLKIGQFWMCVLKVTLKSICLVSPLGGFEDCKYQSQQAMVLLIKIAYVLLTWASK